MAKLLQMLRSAWYMVTDQSRIIYHPDYGDCLDFNACGHFDDDHKLRWGGSRLYKEDGDPALLLYHGNAGTACRWKGWAREYGLLLPEYPGFGADGRKPCMEAILRDVENIVSHLDSDPVIVGWSLGSGPASYHAAIAQPEKAILISPFSNAADMGKRVFPWMPEWLFRAALKEDYRNTEWISQYRGDLLILTEQDDDFSAMARMIYDAAGGKKRLVEIPGIDHVGLVRSAAAWDAIDGFLRQ